MRVRFPAFLLALVLLAAGAVTPVGAIAKSAPKKHQPKKHPRKKHPKRHPKKPARVPLGFVGMNVDGPLLDPTANINMGPELDQMVATGVERTRVVFNWNQAEPYPNLAAVPGNQHNKYTVIGGVPTSFASTDQLVGAAASRGLTVLPVVIYAPSWYSIPNIHGIATPAGTAIYANYLTALVGRYGPHGSFWFQHPSLPRLPIRMWQIWNEPNLPAYWPQPFASSYVALVRAAHSAIKAADPGATVVLGALTNVVWTYLAEIYAIPGARGQFDAVSVNAFTKTPSGVIQFLQLVRNEMARNGDRGKPLIASELSWPSALGSTHQVYDFNTTEQGQASNIAALLPLLASHRKQLGLLGFMWYTWIGDEFPGAPAFHFSGLIGLDGGQLVAKPALTAFRRGALALERCRRKASVATRCTKSY